MTKESFLELGGVSAGYGASRVLNGIDLAIAKGEFVALLGASGCGKTTLLRTIAGFVSPSAGSIKVAGRDVTRLPPDKRGMALVFQSYALWPHMTVAQNVGYGLKLKRHSRTEISRRVVEMEKLLGLSGLGDRKPAQLSGGQRQRVALGRALAIDPEILLLDEPLSNLDARIRLTVRHEIRALQKRLGITAVHVTHDREEAMVMADRIVILDAGRIAQQGTPEAVYNRPASAFVAAFMGAENTVSLWGQPSSGRFEIESGPANAPCTVPIEGRALSRGFVEARFRAEAAQLLPGNAADVAAAGTLELSGHVETVSYPGGLWRHAVRVGVDMILVDARKAYGQGEAVKVRIPTEVLFLFSTQEAQPLASTLSRPGGTKGRSLETSEA
jgi:putative spermidine/putrescine transport system ATP-binding protein